MFCAVAAAFVRLFCFASDMAQDTGGALDPTIYPVLTAWGFTTDSYQVPSREELDTLLSYADYQSIQLTGDTVTVPAECQLDLGAVAKGYIGDLAADRFRERGVTSALMNLGGNVQAVGAKPGAPGGHRPDHLPGGKQDTQSRFPA